MFLDLISPELTNFPNSETILKFSIVMLPALEKFPDKNTKELF